MKYFKATKALYLFALLFLAMLSLMLCSCEDDALKTDKDKLNTAAETNTTISSLGEFYDFGGIPVRGFGIVANLAGTGSSECPPDLRSVLVKYIKQQMSGQSSINPNSFIESEDTAIVEVYGSIPPLALKGDRFDLKVVTFPRTQTTSLAGGRLFTTDLTAMARFMGFDQYSKTLAKAAGPIFIDKINNQYNEKFGYVLGGGRVSADAQIVMSLFEPNYYTANAIRNRLNERFGHGTAKATSASEILLRIPDKFRNEKAKFLAMVRLLYLTDNRQLEQKRIETLVQDLVSSDDKLTNELSLNAIGKAAIDKLAPLLNNPDQRIRLHAARCMLDIGDDRALGTLRKIIADRNSAYRIEAINAVGQSAKRNDAIGILNRAMGESDFQVRYAAYEHLRNLGDISISRTLVGGDFFVENVISSGPKVIFVTRSGIPRIVLFSSPIYCNNDLFIESDNRDIIINAMPGKNVVSVMRKHPTQSRLIGPVATSSKLTDVIRILGETIPVKDKEQLRPGLGVSYSDIVSLLEQMYRNGAVNAEFLSGELTEVGTILEKKAADDR